MSARGSPGWTTCGPSPLRTAASAPWQATRNKRARGPRQVFANEGSAPALAKSALNRSLRPLRSERAAGCLRPKIWPLTPSRYPSYIPLKAPSDMQSYCRFRNRVAGGTCDQITYWAKCQTRGRGMGHRLNKHRPRGGNNTDIERVAQSGKGVMLSSSVGGIPRCALPLDRCACGHALRAQADVCNHRCDRVSSEAHQVHTETPVDLTTTHIHIQ